MHRWSRCRSDHTTHVRGLGRLRRRAAGGEVAAEEVALLFLGWEQLEAHGAGARILEEVIGEVEGTIVVRGVPADKQRDE